MALILEGKATLLECHGCGELYLEGDGPNRSNPYAVAAWRAKHVDCAPPEQILRASAPKMEQDLATLVLGPLLELAGAVAHTWNPLPVGAALVTEREELIRQASGEIAKELVQKLELGLLPGRLEQAARRIVELQVQLDQERALAANQDAALDKATELAELQAAVVDDQKRALEDLQARHLALGGRVIELEDQLRRAPDGQREPPEDLLEETVRTGSLG